MAPSSVLLNRNVYIEHEASKTGGELLIGDERSSTEPPRHSRLHPSVPADPETRRTLRRSTGIIVPPHTSADGINTAAMRRHHLRLDRKHRQESGRPLRRPLSRRRQGYLIYDASKNSLSTIPQPPYDYSRAGLGLGAVVVCLEEDTYLLAELTRIRGSDPPEAALCTWRPSSAEWTVKVASFPPELSPPNYFFEADMCFSYRGSILCWMDLCKGMVICDLTMLQIEGRLEFHFIPLPRECMTYDRFERPLLPEQFRSVACIGGSIKFVTMDGYGQQPGHELSLTIWTLSTNLSGWNKDKEYHVRDIWASEAYCSLGLPNILPSFPVLSMDEDDIICLVVTHWNRAVDGKVEYRGQYLFSVDMKHNKVSHRPTNTEQLHSQPFASQCSAYCSA